MNPLKASQWAAALKDHNRSAASISTLADSLVTLKDAAAVIEQLLSMLPSDSLEKKIEAAMHRLEALAESHFLEALLLMEALKSPASDLHLSDIYDSIGLWQAEDIHQFRIFLHDVPPHSARCENDKDAVDDEDETANTLLMRICAALEDTTPTRCEVRGFGLRWQVNVAHDFCMVLEDLPRVLPDLKAGKDATVVFCEQGLERLVHLHPSRRTARCVDMNTRADLGRAWFAPDLLVENLHKVLVSFVSYAWQAFPTTAAHPLFVEWQNICLPEAA